MAKYTKQQKENILKLLFPPENKSVPVVHKLTGIPQSTLHTWKAKVRSQQVNMPKEIPIQSWSSEQKLNVIIETAALSQPELAAYCRKKGLYVEQVDQWKREFIQPEQPSQKLKKSLQVEKQRCQQLEKELKRKEKALAEAAALLVLQKKAQSIWGQDEEA
ncbi:hypothetical protein H0A36_27415 [Endozoicomonas sp. SM1973]|uniref:Transposase n=1 Tax=Spartinivicinus marinus TaxID=2994442 RepID=A0A853IKZ6_9GAMM|nr:hypothetical protein [Spartinivicinus marinus]MCX4028833.1 hypothetical protein [Spartinivicinus marinus]NYZ69745.1 hypothetical protein [Spartinivicinus marinus]